VMMAGTLAAGWGYAAVGANVFWGMAGMCGVAVMPLALRRL
jgi:hypothetical protein